MPSNTLEKTLHSVLHEISNGLAKKVKSAIERELVKVNKAKGLDKLMTKRDELEALRKKVDYDLTVIYKDISEREGTYRDELSEEEVSILNAICSYHERTKSRVEAVRKSLKSPEVENFLNFNKVKENTETMFSLAITQKEKRNVIFALQSREWRSLGLEIPQLPHFEKFTIENGMIVVPEVSMIESK